MIDIIPTIADMLADIGTVELQFPNTTADFPVITLSEIANQSDTVLHGAERLSVITVQIDIWDKADTGNLEGEQVAAFRNNKCDFFRFVFCNIFRPDHSEYKDLHDVCRRQKRNYGT